MEPVVAVLAAVMYANFCARIEPDARIYHASDLSWLKLVPRWPADPVERFADVFWYGLFGGDGVVACVDLDAGSGVGS